ncbi:MAG TPA: DUF3313 family protein [Gammaproteobacteria bacterium]
MKRKIPTAILSAAAGLMLFWYVGGGRAELPLATEQDADVTEEGLHRVHPAIMEAAWVKPDFDLASFTRILLMPTAVQFRDVPDRTDDARSRASAEEFPLAEDRKEWLRDLWRQAVEARFQRDEVYEPFGLIDSNVLIVQGFLVDVVSRIPPDAPGSSYTLVSNPWSVTVVLELRDATNGELLARTIDRRNAQGLLEVGAVWHQTEDLVEHWAQALSHRLDQLSELGGRPSRTPTWWTR